MEWFEFKFHIHLLGWKVINQFSFWRDKEQRESYRGLLAMVHYVLLEYP